MGKTMFWGEKKEISRHNKVYEDWVVKEGRHCKYREQHEQLILSGLIRKNLCKQQINITPNTWTEANSTQINKKLLHSGDSQKLMHCTEF